MWTRESDAARSSTRAPVPSGEPSSTIRTSIMGACASTASMILRTFSRSLYVGMITSARSGTSDLPENGSSPPPGQGEQQRGDGHRLPFFVGRAREPELDFPRSCRQLDANERYVGAADVR